MSFSRDDDDNQHIHSGEATKRAFSSFFVNLLFSVPKIDPLDNSNESIMGFISQFEEGDIKNTSVEYALGGPTMMKLLIIYFDDIRDAFDGETRYKGNGIEDVEGTNKDVPIDIGYS